MIKSTRRFLFLSVLCLALIGPAHAFVVPPQRVVAAAAVVRSSTRTQQLYSEPPEMSREERLRNLGYSEKEITKKAASADPAQDQKVRVDLVEDVDPLTLTAIGFGLIAFNFLVLGNLGDGGIGGLVATVINLSNQ